MTKFLEAVARTYFHHERESMRDFLFVFPNRRAGTFFMHHLRMVADRPVIAPEVMTMSQLVRSWSSLGEASPFEQLLLLFNLHRGQSDDTFDRFRFWGEMILEDFDSVDSCLVDARKLFENLASLKEISTDFLTDEQRDIIARYWPVEMQPRKSTGSFWNHISPGQNSFSRRWAELFNLYTGLRRELRSRGLASKGMFLRDAAERLGTDGIHMLRHKRYVFVGFNYLSPAELKIMHLLSRLDVADFYWKNNSPALLMEGNRAGTWIRRYSSAFPSLYPLEEEEITSWPRIEIVGVPSATGQAEVLSEYLEKHHNTDSSQTDNAIDTAVVLPDESLLMSVINAVPERFTALNVTMGLPMRSTSVAALFSQLGSMHAKATTRNGSVHYFCEHVKAILTNPLVAKVSADGCSAVLSVIVRDRLFLIPASTIEQCAPELACLFSPNWRDNAEGLKNYILAVAEKLASYLDPESHETIVLKALTEHVTLIESLSAQYGVEMLGITAFRLLERSLSSLTIPLEGKPLKGLQIMGTLETRALDFDNIYILSMNEGVYPRKHPRRSFIPDSLRQAYGMNTSAHDESVMAYNFYSMISRASQVTLIYDARVGGTNSGQISRYCAQLLYLSGADISHRLATFSPALFNSDSLTIHKNARILDSLNRFLSEDNDALCFSASALKDYIECPLRFYLVHIERLNMEETNTEFIDSSDYGTVLHEVAENIYKRLLNNRVLTPEALDSVIENPSRIDRYVTAAMNGIVYRRSDPATPLPPEGRLIGSVIRNIILEMLRCEKKFTPMKFVEAERNRTTRLTLPSGLTVNVKAYIDRVDIVNCDANGNGGTLRCVDYKTGSEEMSVQSVESLFNASSGHYPKAIFQLMLYCNIYAAMENYTGPVQPFIYAFKTIAVNGLQPLKYGDRAKKEVLTDFHVLNKEYLECLDRLLRELFDPNVPFRQACTDKVCTFCSFKRICGRS